MTEKTLYLKCAPGQVGELVLLTGDPARVDRAARQLEDAQLIARNREFVTFSGRHGGRSVSVVSSGIGAPSAAIALEELSQLGVKAIVRVGTMMGIGAPLGTYVIASGAARFEGTSSAYLPLQYPALPNWALTSALERAGRARGLAVQVGLTATYDAFYPKMAPALVGRGLPDIDQLQQAGVLALDMETALVFVVGARLNVATASMCLVTNEADPFAVLDADKQANGEAALFGAVLDGLAAWSEADGR